LHMAMGVSRAENASLPFFGAVIRSTQAILVDRKDPRARKNVAATLKERATSSAWHASGPVGIFPEGTTHSQNCLIHFKSGAFRSGVPVQLVLVRMPWRFEDPAWAAGGPSLYELVFRSMCQFYVNLELEYLPVKPPTAEERKDATLYAKHAQQRCAEVLGVPMTHHSIADVFLSNAARKLHKVDGIQGRQAMVTAAAGVQLSDLDKMVDMDVDLAKAYLKRFAALDTSNDARLSFKEFQAGFDMKDEELAKHLFVLLDTDESGTIDFREFVLGITILNGRATGGLQVPRGAKPAEAAAIREGQQKNGLEAAVALSFDVFDRDNNGAIPVGVFTSLLRKAFPALSAEEIKKYQADADTDSDGKVTKKEFIGFCSKMHEHKNAFRDAHFGNVFIAQPPPRKKK